MDMDMTGFFIVCVCDRFIHGLAVIIKSASLSSQTVETVYIV